MKLTKEEEQLILEKRKKEEASKPKLMGFAKEDVYITHLDNCQFELDDWLFSKKEMEDQLEEFKSEFELVSKVGSRFVCFIEEDGRQSWYDEEYGLEALPEKWAEEHLKDIQPYKNMKGCPKH